MGQMKMGRVGQIHTLQGVCLHDLEAMTRKTERDSRKSHRKVCPDFQTGVGEKVTWLNSWFFSFLLMALGELFGSGHPGCFHLNNGFDPACLTRSGPTS